MSGSDPSGLGAGAPGGGAAVSECPRRVADCRACGLELLDHRHARAARFDANGHLERSNAAWDAELGAIESLSGLLGAARSAEILAAIALERPCRVDGIPGDLTSLSGWVGACRPAGPGHAIVTLLPGASLPEVLHDVLEEAETWRTVASSLTDMVLTFDHRARITSASRDLPWIARGDAIGRSLFELTAPGSRATLASVVARVLAGEGPVEAELQAGQGPGRIYAVRAVALPGRPPRGVLVANDVSERRATEDGLRRLAAIFESSGEAMLVSDHTGAIEAWNPAAEALFGYSADEMIGQSFHRLVPAERQAELAHVRAVAASGEAGTLTTERRNRHGELIPVRVTLSRVQPPPWFKISAVVRDLRAEQHAQLVEDRARLERIAREEERERIARDLHDGIGQWLTAIRLKAGAARGRGRAWKGVLDEIEAAAATAHREVRRISFALGPAGLEEDGLIAALGRLCEGSRMEGGARVVWTATGGFPRLPPEHETHVYRIAQEALSNALRHATARRIEVSLSHAHGEARLRVEDDGGGASEASAAVGLGLRSMWERAAALGGRLAVSRNAAGGWTVEAKWPAPGAHDPPG